MTEQQHCEHECVCPDYKASHSDWEEDPDPCDISCYHRSRPAPAADADISINALAELHAWAKKHQDECIAIQTVIVVEEIERLQKLVVSIQKQHDAAIRKDEDKHWKAFEDWLISTPFPQDSQKIVAKILKKTCSIRESLRREGDP